MLRMRSVIFTEKPAESMTTISPFQEQAIRDAFGDPLGPRPFGLHVYPKGVTTTVSVGKGGQYSQVSPLQ
jgi:hypothetical protein